MRNKSGPDGWWFHGDTVSAFPLHDCLALFKSIWFSASTADLPWTNFSHCRLPSWLTYHGLPVAYGTCRPAGGNFTVEMAGSRAFTTLSYGGKFAKEFGNGADQPLRQLPDVEWSVMPLLVYPNWTDCLLIASPHQIYMQRMNLVYTPSTLCVQWYPIIIFPEAAGYAFAISYQNDVSKVTLENLVIFTTKYQYAITPLWGLSLTAAAQYSLPQNSHLRRPRRHARVPRGRLYLRRSLDP